MNNIFRNVEGIKNALPRDKKITLVGGCFDLIHIGHVHVFEYAASLEDLLVVAVLSDECVRRYKGPQRPIINQKQRAEMVASIRYVGLVYISDTSPSSPATLELLKPDSVVFCEDQSDGQKKQRTGNIARYSPNTKIRLLPRYQEEEVSTGRIIAKIKGV